MRCCLARSLLTYPGKTTTDGGTVLIPDLTEQMPEISADGLTWTFHLRSGIHYAPPNDSLEVTSADFVTAVERSIRINSVEEPFVPPPFGMIDGAQEFAERTASTVSGLQAPDPHTLVVHLKVAYGGLDWLADIGWAPVPASIAAGHDDDLGLFWPSTGPYMYETTPANSAGSSVTLVRNPQWSATTDSRRQANVERIQLIPVSEDLAAEWARVDRDELDFITARLDNDLASRYRSDPATTGRVRSTESEYLYRMPMNLAIPPFDDIAVRRAVIFAVDRVAARDSIIEALTANGTTQPPTILSTHMSADSLTGGLLRGYDPFAFGDGRGNLSRARTEVAKSPYDADHDGLCDAEACTGIPMPVFDLPSGEVIARSLEGIGIEVQPVAMDDANAMWVPANRTALALFDFGWGFELSGTEFSLLAKGGTDFVGDIYAVNTSLVGATPEALQGWGYSITSVPSVDDVVARCDREIGNRRARCWADLDEILAESIAPWVPLFAFDSVWVSSDRVEQYTLDQATFQQGPAWDKVSLVPGSD